MVLEFSFGTCLFTIPTLRLSRVELVQSGTFWLSDEPAVAGWRNFQ